MNNIRFVGEGQVYLLASPSRTYADIAAKVCTSGLPTPELIGSPENTELVRRVMASGHLAVAEFDSWVFLVEGYSRVCEAQLIRKRHASYMIQSGRTEKHGKRQHDYTLPRNIYDHTTFVELLTTNMKKVKVELGPADIIKIIDQWYNDGVEEFGLAEEELRYLKPQATSWRGLICMNSHALLDWFGQRCCMRAQAEIRDMANKMRAICKRECPAVFAEAGPKCRSLGYCPEGKLQHKSCKMPTKEEVMEVIKNLRK